MLDLILFTGLDLLSASTRFRSAMMHVGGWSSESSMDRHLSRLKEKGWIVWDDSRETGAWVAKVTEEGKAALGEESAQSEPWPSEWDGLWRIMTFDLPEMARDQRHQLRSWLKKRRFGRLQGSVWVSARPAEWWLPSLSRLKVDPHAAVFLEGRPLGKLNDSDYVRKAWDWEGLRADYDAYLKHLSSSPAVYGGEQSSLEKRFATWYAAEAELWRGVFDNDPLLPRPLWPKGYQGEKALEARKAAYARWGKALA